jgi:hypothetical protein
MTTMQDLPPAPAQAANMAKRGDLVVIAQHNRDYMLRGENREYDSFIVGVVTSVTRDGQVKMFRRAGSFDQGKDWRGQPDRGEAMPARTVHSYVSSSSDIDVAGALATAGCHVWPSGHESPMPFESLAEVREWLKPHRKAGWKWNLLRDAGEAWEAAHRKAAPMLTEALRYQGDEFTARSAAYSAAILAAQNAYRAAYAEAIS